MKPCWNVISLALPVAAGVAGVVAMLSGGSRGGDFAGALGDGVKFLVAMGGVCLVGEAAAIFALARGERLAGISILGAVVNALVIVPVALLLLRRD